MTNNPWVAAIIISGRASALSNASRLSCQDGCNLGETSYAIGLGVAQITQSILRNQNRVLTVSSLINDIHGIQDVWLSLPACGS